MSRSWFTVKALAGDRAEVSIFEEIGIWGISAKQFLDQFRAIAAPNVDVFINSPGGSVMDAVAMMNGMIASGKNITVTVLGIAASAASYVVLAGQHRVMPENTFQFLHDPLSGLYGDAEELRALADTLDKVRDSIVATYTKRTGRDAAAFLALMKADALMTAQECLDAGLVDEVTPAVPIAAKFDAERPDLPEAVRVVMRKAPAPSGVSFAQQVRQLAEGAGLGEFAAAFALDDAVHTVAQAQGAIADALEIKELCALVKRPEMAGPLILARKSLAEARGVIQKARVAVDLSAFIDTAPRLRKPAGGGEFSVTGFWRERQAAKV